MSTPLLKRRTIILTGATAAITAVGAFTGAQLKTDADKRAVVEEGLEARIERMKLYREGLVRRKVELEAKIARLREGNGGRDYRLG